MAWIKSYQELERHPKTIVLMKEMNWPLDVAISKLHRLWWWCADYAYDGDISKHDPDTMATAIGCGDMKGEFLIAAFIKSGFIDREPYLRLHDWWAHFGDFLKARFSRTPAVWKLVESKYISGCHQHPTSTQPAPNQVATRNPLDKGNKGNKEIATTLFDKSNGFVQFWRAYPRKTGRLAAAKAWKVKSPPLAKCLAALSWLVKSEQWTKEGGQYIPLPATWLNQGRWDDVPPTHELVVCDVCGHEGVLPKGTPGLRKCGECRKKELV